MNENRFAKERGQSLILVAAAMVVLVGFVAVAVDLSSAYYARRTAQNAADGAALAGASRLATGVNKNNPKLDDDVKVDMNDFAERNGIADTDPDDEEVNDNVEGWYVDSNGNRLPDVPMIGDDPNDDAPEDAYGVEAITYITATSFFGGIFGIRGYPIQARAVSNVKLACDSDCVVPFTVNLNLLIDPDTDKPRSTCFHVWTERDKQADAISSGALGWVNWTWQELVSVCSTLKKPEKYECWDGRACPVDQGPGCQEGALEANLNAVLNCANGFVKVGDWMSSATGDMGSVDVRCWLSYYAGYVDPDIQEDKFCPSSGEPHSMIIPVYDISTAELPSGPTTPCLTMKDPCDPKSGGLHYRVAGFARAWLLQYQLSSGHEVPPDESVNYPEGVESLDECYDYYDLDLSACALLTGDAWQNCVDALVAADTDGFRITILLENYVQDAVSSSSCADPWGTLLSSPKITQ